jgi:hypothetical protein
MGLLLVGISLFMYFLPSLIGSKKKNIGAIIALNFFLGWTVIGWVVALVWALTHDDEKAPVVIHQPKAVPASSQIFCTHCGSEVGRDDKFCCGCGAALPVEMSSNVMPPANPDSGQRNAAPALTKSSLSVFGIGSILGVSLIDWSLYATRTSENRQDGASPMKASGRPVESELAFNTGNVANDKLLAKTPEDQALYLGVVVNAGCQGTRAFYMGMSPSDHSAFWSVACRNRSSYGVQIEADAGGSTRVLECSVLKAVAGTSCFTKFANQ